MNIQKLGRQLSYWRLAICQDSTKAIYWARIHRVHTHLANIAPLDYLF